MAEIYSNSYDIVITTYNRKDSVQALVEAILTHKKSPKKIIIVDSSEEVNIAIQKHSKVMYIHSSHANQPYQRYIGYLASTSSLLVYLDDDMEIVDENAFEKIIQRFYKSDIVGLAINFINNNDFMNNKLPKSKFVSSTGFKNYVLNFLKMLSGQSNLNDGQYWYNGLKGEQPKVGGYTEWFRGGAFAAKREFLYIGFNFKLFDLYEEGLGKGEDGIIGYTLSKQGRLLFEPDVFFIHHDKKDSTYTKDFFSFSQRVVYSRLFLSYEFSRLDNRPLWKATIYYHWYILWRVVGMIANQFLDHQESRKEMLRGYISGWNLARPSQKVLKKYEDEAYWREEAENDIRS